MLKISCWYLLFAFAWTSPAFSHASLLDENAYPPIATRSAIAALGSCGNADQFMKEIGSSDTLKDVGLMALTAGATRGLGQAVGAASHGLKATAVQAGVSTLGRMMSGEKDLGRAALQGTLTAAATSVGALAANQIGEMYAQGTGSLSYMEHKGLHAVVGAGLGAASNLQDPLKGAAGGATGAVVAEVSAEALQHSLGDTWKKSTYGTIGKFSGTLAGWAAGDANAGSLTAVSAMENNFDLSQAKHLSQTRSETDFVDDMLADHEQEKGPISEAQRSVLKERFLKLYYMLPQVDLAQTFGNPGHERVEDITSLSFEELRAQRLAEIAPTHLATSEERQRAEQAIRNEYQAWQSKQAEMAMGGVLAATMGGGALRGAALKGKAPSVSSTSGVAGAPDLLGPRRPTEAGYKPPRQIAPMVEMAADSLRTQKVAPYEVGRYNELARRSRLDGMEIHHAPQSHPASQIIEGYNVRTAPSISLPAEEHWQIPNIRGHYTGLPRELLARDMKNLRTHTNTPNKQIQELIELNKKCAPEAFQKRR